MTKRYTREQWISMAIEKHGNRYDYSMVTYKGMAHSIRIVCHTHGEFVQKAQSHILGSGCPVCANEKRDERFALSATQRRVGSQALIARFKTKHGDRYDYSKVKSGGTKSRVEIICNEHGSFTQLANNHLAGKGCPACGLKTTVSKKTLDQEEFVRRVLAVHGSRYELHNARYVKQTVCVELVCSKHGPFKIRPDNLWAGGGCQQCSREEAGKRSRLGTKKFIDLAKKVHGKTYSYANTNYLTARDKIVVTCPTHGDFYPTPANHLSGSGCPVCARRIAAEKHSQLLTKAQDDVIHTFREVHGDRYDYGEVRYSHSMRKITIICPEHGRFSQTPTAHAAGKGCLECGRTVAAQKRTLSTGEVLERFRSLHGERYDYSRVEYAKYNRKVVILCAEHGEFKQTPQSHLEGKGCPGCAQSSGETRVANWLKSNGYDFLVEWRLPVKISASRNRYARYDFFIPDESLFIEFDGPHHFQPVRYAGMSEEDAERVHKSTLKRDLQKDAWAAKAGFFVHRIRWDENVDQSLENFFNRSR